MRNMTSYVASMLSTLVICAPKIYIFMNAYFVQDYDSNEEEGDEDATLENQYYNAKALKEDNAAEALKAFEKVLKIYYEF